MRRTSQLCILVAFLFLAQLIPAATFPATAQDGRQWITHIVQPEENLFRIALQYNLTVEVLMVANHLNDPNLVMVGQRLMIPVAMGASPSVTPPPADTIPTTVLGGEVMHTVSAGETLTGIAEYYDVTLPALLAANDLTGAEKLFAGQILVIPVAFAADLGLIGVEMLVAVAPNIPPADAAPPAADTGLLPVDDLGILDANSPAAVVLNAGPPAAASPAAINPAPTVDPALAQPDLGIIPPEAAAWQLAGRFISLGGDNVRQIYLNGLARGNNPHAFSKLGDCNSAAPYFLVKFDGGIYDLGPYSHLQPVIDHFSGSFARASMTVWSGNHVWAVLDPAWANPAHCWAGETPLACELRLNRPSILLIRLGTNEVGSPQLFEQKMREVIEFTIANGTIPVLGTKADRLEGDDSMNGIIRALAEEYDIPLWDFSRVAEQIPSRGLMPDGFHLNYFPPNYTQALALQSGHPVQNLTALMVLDAVWREVMQ